MKLTNIFYLGFYFSLLFFAISCESEEPEPVDDIYPVIEIASPRQVSDLYYSGDTLFIEVTVTDKGTLNQVNTLIEDSYGDIVFTFNNQVTSSMFSIDTIYIFHNIQCTNYFLTVEATNTAGYKSEKKIYVHSMP